MSLLFFQKLKPQESPFIHFQVPSYNHKYVCTYVYIGTGSEFYVCRSLVTFVKSFPPIQEFPLNLPLIKLLATAFGTVARIALPSFLHSLRACKKHEKKMIEPHYVYPLLIR